MKLQRSVCSVGLEFDCETFGLDALSCFQDILLYRGPPSCVRARRLPHARRRRALLGIPEPELEYLHHVDERGTFMFDRHLLSSIRRGVPYN